MPLSDWWKSREQRDDVEQPLCADEPRPSPPLTRRQRALLTKLSFLSSGLAFIPALALARSASAALMDTPPDAPPDSATYVLGYCLLVTTLIATGLATYFSGAAVLRRGNAYGGADSDADSGQDATDDEGGEGTGARAGAAPSHPPTR